MRKFIITSVKFDGEAVLVYNEKETLCLIDCTKASMTEDTIAAFKRAVPVTIPILQGGQSFSPDTVVRESDFVVDFKKFYDEYPLKRNRYRAEKVWDKMTGTQQVVAYYSLSRYKKYLTRSGIFAMGADKYLADHHYETEWNKV